MYRSEAMATTAHKRIPLADPAHAAHEDALDDADNTRTVELPAFVYPRALRTNELTMPVGDCLESIIESELYLRECANAVDCDGEDL